MKGWYYYDKYKKKIPLVGIYDDGLVLYSFHDKKRMSEVENLIQQEEEHFWDNIERLKNLTEYKEKITIQDLESEWTDGKNRLKVKLFDAEHTIYRQKEYLKIKEGDKEKVIDLSDLGLYEHNFTLEKYNFSAKEKKFLLSYEYPSNYYYAGQCGVAEDFGYIIVKYDASYQLSDIQKAVIYDCRSFVYYEEEKCSPKIIQYKNHDTSERLLIDLHTLEFLKSNI